MYIRHFGCVLLLLLLLQAAVVGDGPSRPANNELIRRIERFGRYETEGVPPNNRIVKVKQDALEVSDESIAFARNS